MRTLIIASPHKTGQVVKDAQYTLNGHNVFKGDYFTGTVDGVFGEETARACKRAKFWLGYPNRLIRPNYGNALNNYLSGKRKLPPAWAARRRRRLADKPKVSLGNKALAKAITQIGVKESPHGSNNTKYGRWYGANYNPWCAMFLTWCFKSVGSKSWRRGIFYSYVPNIVSDARRGVNGLAITYHPVPGDAVCFDWDHDGIADHVGIYEKDLGGGNFQSVEGNTGEGNDSNGGEVMRRHRNTSQVKAFVHCSR